MSNEERIAIFKGSKVLSAERVAEPVRAFPSWNGLYRQAIITARDEDGNQVMVTLDPSTARRIAKELQAVADRPLKAFED